MLDAVLDAIAAGLETAGLSAVRQFPETALDRAEGPVVCVGLRRFELLSAGCGDYLGQKTLGGVVSEVYGFRVDCAVALDIYSPADGENGAAGCLRAYQSLSAALATLPSGLRRRSLSCGETGYDERTGMFLMPAELRAMAMLTREANGETGEFTDFTLRGVMI